MCVCAHAFTSKSFSSFFLSFLMVCLPEFQGKEPASECEILGYNLVCSGIESVHFSKWDDFSIINLYSTTVPQKMHPLYTQRPKMLHFVLSISGHLHRRWGGGGGSSFGGTVESLFYDHHKDQAKVVLKVGWCLHGQGYI